jgi:hypothetical protein
MSQRFPRSLREAFPAERFAAIEASPRRPRITGDRVVVYVMILGIAAISLMASWGWI